MGAETIKIAPEVSFTAPDGSEVTLRQVRMRANYVSDQLKDVVVMGEMDAATWTRVDAGGWFRMPPDVRGPCMDGGFDASPAIEIEARLSPEILMVATLLTGNIWEMGGELRGAGQVPDMHKTESWIGTIVKQDRGGLKTGFATRASGMLPASRQRA